MMYYGAQYYRPPFPGGECWQRDFENMQALGFTCVKLWAVDRACCRFRLVYSVWRVE